MKLLALTLFAITLLLPKLSLAQTELTFSDEIRATYEWAQGPLVGGESTLILKFMDGSGSPVELTSDLAVVLWMPDMGHGSAPTTIERSHDAQGNLIPGEHLVSKMYFVMPGLWEVRVERELSEGIVETQSFEIEL